MDEEMLWSSCANSDLPGRLVPHQQSKHTLSAFDNEQTSQRKTLKKLHHCLTIIAKPCSFGGEQR